MQPRRVLLPLCTFVLISSMSGIRCGKGGSGSPTAPTPASPAAAKVGAFTISTFSTSFDQTSAEHRYGLRLSVRETGGQTGGTLGLVELTFSRDGVTIGTSMIDQASSDAHLNAGATADARAITISNTQADRQVATRVSVKVNFVDDGQKTGSVTASADVPQPPAPPAATYTLSCTVQDDDTNSFLGDARVEVVGGANAGRSTLTSSNGQCSLSGLSPGGFTVRVTRSGYQDLDRSVSMTGDVRLELKIKKTASAPGPTPPGPTPPGPTPPGPTPPGPTPGPTPPGPGGIPICTGSAPASVSCGVPTARCNDDTWSCSQNRSGTCSSHSGVACWVCPGALCNGFRDPGGITFPQTR